VTDQPITPRPAKRIIDDPDLADGNPIDTDLLRRAAQFMSTAREIQRRSGKTLKGRKRLTAETIDALERAACDSKLLAWLDHSPQAVSSETQRQAFETFEEVCRRRRFTIPKVMRGSVYRLLAIEIAVNAELFRASPEAMRQATVYNGSLDHLFEDFRELRDTPYIFREAAVNYPSDPEAFLVRVQENIARLSQDDRFAGFRDTPYIFRQAAVNYPSDPDTYLSDFLKKKNRPIELATSRVTPGLSTSNGFHR
jgi:hypothetical protein